MIGQSFCYSHSNVFKKRNISRSFYVERSPLSGTRGLRKSCFGRKIQCTFGFLENVLLKRFEINPFCQQVDT